MLQCIPFLLCVSTVAAVPILPKKATSDTPKPGYIREELFSGPDFEAILVSLGSDNQTVLLKVDTNTPDFWVNANNNDYCRAFYPLSLSNSSDWNEFDTGIQEVVNENIEKLQWSQASQLKTISTANASAMASLARVRNSQFEQFISKETESVGSKISEFISTADGYIPTNGVTFGAPLTSKGGLYATKTDDDEVGLKTSVTSIDGTLYTMVTGFVDYNASTKFGKREDDEHDGHEEHDEHDDADGNGNGNGNTGFAHHSRLSSSLLKASSVAFTSTASFVPTASSFYEPSQSSAATNIPADSFLYEIERDCSLFGTYNTTSSDTLELSDEQLLILSTEQFALGPIGNEHVTIGNITINTTIGIAESSDSNVGVLGIGKSNNDSLFESFPTLLARSGEIWKPFYSFYAGSDRSVLLFGAVEEELFYGNVTLVPILNDTESIAITLDAIDLIYEFESSIGSDSGSMGGLGPSGRDNRYYSDDKSNQKRSRQFYKRDYGSFGDGKGSDRTRRTMTKPIAAGKAIAYVNTATKPLLLPRDILLSLVSSLNTIFNVTFSEDYGRFILQLTNPVKGTGVDRGDVFLVFNFQGTQFYAPLENFLLSLEDDEILYYNKTSPFDESITNSSFYFAYDDDEDPSEQFIGETTDDIISSTTDRFIFTILPSDDDSVTLGLDFWKDSVALFVDLEKHQVGLGYSTISDELDDERTIIIVNDTIPHAEYAKEYESYYGASSGDSSPSPTKLYPF
jgi:hypothetical protein